MTATGLERAPPRRRYRRMEELTLSPRAFARPQSRPLREPAAWALPPVERFNGRAANDETVHTLGPDEIPRWVIVAGGAVLAAVMGALLGGALAV